MSNLQLFTEPGGDGGGANGGNGAGAGAAAGGQGEGCSSNSAALEHGSSGDLLHC